MVPVGFDRRPDPGTVVRRIIYWADYTRYTMDGTLIYEPLFRIMHLDLIVTYSAAVINIKMGTNCG